MTYILGLLASMVVSRWYPWFQAPPWPSLNCRNHWGVGGPSKVWKVVSDPPSALVHSSTQHSSTQALIHTQKYRDVFLQLYMPFNFIINIEKNYCILFVSLCLSLSVCYSNLNVAKFWLNLIYHLRITLKTHTHLSNNHKLRIAHCIHDWREEINLN